MSLLGTAFRRHHSGNFRLISLLRKLEWFHLDQFIFLVVRRRHHHIDELLNVLSIVWSHAFPNRTPQFIVEKVTAINSPHVLRMAIVHQIKVVGTAFTCVS
jgi:hypothetical protein